jgi:hypothetical protein
MVFKSMNFVPDYNIVYIKLNYSNEHLEIQWIFIHWIKKVILSLFLKHWKKHKSIFKDMN